MVVVRLGVVRLPGRYGIVLGVGYGSIGRQRELQRAVGAVSTKGNRDYSPAWSSAWLPVLGRRFLALAVIAIVWRAAFWLNAHFD